MDYIEDTDVARLLAHSEELTRRSLDVSERGAQASHTLRRAQQWSDFALAASDRLYAGRADTVPPPGRPAQGPE